jgi:hypothetical protein
MRERLWACGAHLFVRLVACLVEGLLEKGAEIKIFHISLDMSFCVVVRFVPVLVLCQVESGGRSSR